jgi:hypothetical protein
MISLSEDDFQTIYTAIHERAHPYTVEDASRMAVNLGRAWKVVERIREEQVTHTADPSETDPASPPPPSS